MGGSRLVQVKAAVLTRRADRPQQFQNPTTCCAAVHCVPMSRPSGRGQDGMIRACAGSGECANFQSKPTGYSPTGVRASDLALPFQGDLSRCMADAFGWRWS